ncbi:MAG: hypothetical protein FGM57_02125 [Candidatus Taylorbacteria bacterium]|nr:hypothetical protein [Candidatus Taylorbacteria bacterium]
MFFYSKPVVDDVTLREEASLDLVDLLLHTGFDLSTVDRVVGPQTGATLLAEAISKAIGVRRGTLCKWASPAKGTDQEKKTMVWDDPERKVLPGEHVLLCEDVTTTGGSVLLANDAVLKAGGIPFSRVLTLVNRSGENSIGEDLNLLALITKHGPIWSPEECPLCKDGSEAISPKRPETNWELLTA